MVRPPRGMVRPYRPGWLLRWVLPVLGAFVGVLALLWLLGAALQVVVALVLWDATSLVLAGLLVVGSAIYAGWSAVVLGLASTGWWVDDDSLVVVRFGRSPQRYARSRIAVDPSGGTGAQGAAVPVVDPRGPEPTTLPRVRRWSPLLWGGSGPSEIGAALQVWHERGGFRAPVTRRSEDIWCGLAAWSFVACQLVTPLAALVVARRRGWPRLRGFAAVALLLQCAFVGSIAMLVLVSALGDAAFVAAGVVHATFSSYLFVVSLVLGYRGFTGQSIGTRLLPPVVRRRFGTSEPAVG